MTFLVINGVNLNLTGRRETGVYGNETLETLNQKIEAYCKQNGDEVTFYQSNIEGEIVNKLHEAFLGDSAEKRVVDYKANERGTGKAYDGIILNAGAFTHYSYAIRDAIAAINVPVAEVHISNVYAREEFRHKSVLSEVCKGSVCGFGVGSYIAAIEGLKASI